MNISKVSYEINEKLKGIGKPILTVIGTSSNQGKFSLQLELRKKFIEDGYKIGQWASEPQGYLFGINQIFPVGYGSNLNFSEKEIIHFINNQLHEIEMLDCDIILSGIQSHLISEKLYNTHMYPVLQTAILTALQPDAILLVVNKYDSNDYILRTIQFAQSLTNSKVICLVLSFRNVKLSRSSSVLNVNNSIQEEFLIYEQRLYSFTGIPCYSINDINGIYKCMIDYLTQES
jgi:uncharacterized NAD-dependent epimerase/dehydratase family protein